MRVSTPALHITFRDGRAGFYWLCACATFAALSAISLPWPWRLAVWLSTAVYLGWAMRQPAQRGSIIVSGDGALQLGLGDTPPVAVQLLGTSVICAHLLVLHFRGQNQRKVRRLVLWPDSMPADDFRRLRAALRWSKGSAPPTQSAKQHQQSV